MAVYSDEFPQGVREVWCTGVDGSPPGLSPPASVVLGGGDTFDGIDVLSGIPLLPRLSFTDGNFGGIVADGDGDLARDLTLYDVSRQLERCYDHYIPLLLSDLKAPSKPLYTSYRTFLIKNGGVTPSLNELMDMAELAGAHCSELRYRLLGLQQRLIIQDVQHLVRKKSGAEGVAQGDPFKDDGK